MARAQNVETSLSSSRSTPRLWSALLLAVVCLFVCGIAVADDDRIDRLAAQLAENEDFRVRTQAALALGATKSKRAIDPLCKGLDDSNTTVRAAAAAALGKLKLGGEDCLKQRLEVESTASVKSTIKKALARIAGGGDAEPAITADTRYYVAIGKTTDKTGREGGVDSIVRKGMARGAAEADGVVIAPATETEGKAKARLAKFKGLKGFYLIAKVSAPKYADGGLTIKLELSIFTYPGKALKATLPLKLTQPDVSEGDTDAENSLIRDASQRAMAKFVKEADRID